MALSRHNVIKLLDELTPEVREAFIDSIADITSTAQLALIAGHLENGDIEAAVSATHIRQEFLAPLDQTMRAVYFRGGVDALAGLPRLRDPFPEAPSSSGSTPAIRARKPG